ncbi:DgyrCDS5041 [Dimorphilus gyrociliatus]|uniref:DgyrCDS5041 n=1 Tax=Dimorphilus gyrociliatus TaxID=2664684 RepID=A0A7I8VK80_9ANNE|nr:DgyrCDS5041 [Dimorphilus gyrociliatus]
MQRVGRSFATKQLLRKFDNLNARVINIKAQDFEKTAIPILQCNYSNGAHKDVTQANKLVRYGKWGDRDPYKDINGFTLPKFVSQGFLQTPTYIRNYKRYASSDRPLPPPPPPPPTKESVTPYLIIGAAGAAGLGYYLWKNWTEFLALLGICPEDKTDSPTSRKEKRADDPISIKCDKEPERECVVLNTPTPDQPGDGPSAKRLPPPKYPDWKNCPAIPGYASYLIIGAGTAANAAYRAIRTNNPKAKVLIISEECNLPYMRPPLSKELWFNDSRKLTEDLKFKQWNGKERSIFYEKDCFYTSPKELPYKSCGGVAVALGRKVQKIDVENKVVSLDNKWQINYDKLLIATGGKPRQHPIIDNSDEEVKKRTTVYRKIVDFQKLDCVTSKGKSVAVIGGGFLGSELAVALGNKAKKSNAKIYQIFPEKGNMGKVLPQYLSNWTTEKVRNENVNIIPESTLTKATMCKNDKVALTLSNGQEIQVDHIVVAIGLEPDVSIAECSGLEVDPIRGGFLVNAEMKAREDIWVAGDAASFYDIKLGRRRVEHHDHAVVSGRLAGENMSGKSKPYWHQSMFWSDLGPEVGYEAIGLVDSSLPTTAVFAKACKSDSPRAVVEETNENLRSETEESVCIEKVKVDSETKPAPPNGTEDFGKGVIFYTKDNVVVGMVMWNVFNKMSIARRILKEQRKYDDLTEVAKLFDLHENN